MEFSASNVYRQLRKEESAFLFLIFTLPLFRGFFGVALALTFLLILVRLIKNKELPPFQIHWFLPCLFLYYVIAGLATGEPFSTMEKRVALLLLPFMFALSPGLLQSHMERKMKVTFILGNLAAVVICLARAVIRSVHVQGGQWHFESRVYPASNYDVLTSSVMGGNYFFGSEFSYFFDQVTYFGIYLVIAQLFIFSLFTVVDRRRVKISLMLAYLIFTSVLFLLSSKAAIISSFILTFYFLLIVGIQPTARNVILIGFFIGSAFYFANNPRFKVFLENSIKSLEKVDPKAKYGHQLRILSWDAAWSIVRHNWLFGVGEGHKEEKLLAMYQKKGYIYPAERSYNSHNQYLDFLLGGGVILLLFFLAGILHLLSRAALRRDNVFVLFLLIFVFNLLFENLLSRHAGIVIFSIFTCYLGGYHKTRVELSKDAVRRE